jgi:predicted enzyme related to lactoylglutathione lyase
MRSRISLWLLLISVPGSAALAGQVPIDRLAQVTIIVRDQDEALKFYVEKLGFEKRQDQTFGGFRWLTVAPPGQKDVEIVLEKPAADMGPARQQQLAAQIGQAPSWVLESSDVQQAYEILKARGVDFERPPEKLPYGMQAVFKDLYGNSFALVQRR